jgi:hypothetical protein
VIRTRRSLASLTRWIYHPSDDSLESLEEGRRGYKGNSSMKRMVNSGYISFRVNKLEQLKFKVQLVLYFISSTLSHSLPASHRLRRMDARSLLRAKKAESRIDHPYAAYSATGQLRCSICAIPGMSFPVFT